MKAKPTRTHGPGLGQSATPGRVSRDHEYHPAHRGFWALCAPNGEGKGLHPSALQLLAAVLHRTHGRLVSETWLDVPALAAETGLSRASIFRGLRALEAAGAITCGLVDGERWARAFDGPVHGETERPFHALPECLRGRNVRVPRRVWWAIVRTRLSSRAWATLAATAPHLAMAASRGGAALTIAGGRSQLARLPLSPRARREALAELERAGIVRRLPCRKRAALVLTWGPGAELRALDSGAASRTSGPPESQEKARSVSWERREIPAAAAAEALEVAENEALSTVEPATDGGSPSEPPAGLEPTAVTEHREPPRDPRPHKPPRRRRSEACSQRSRASGKDRTEQAWEQMLEAGAAYGSSAGAWKLTPWQRSALDRLVAKHGLGVGARIAHGYRWKHRNATTWEGRETCFAPATLLGDKAESYLAAFDATRRDGASPPFAQKPSTLKASATSGPNATSREEWDEISEKREAEQREQQLATIAAAWGRYRAAGGQWDRERFGKAARDFLDRLGRDDGSACEARASAAGDVEAITRWVADLEAAAGTPAPTAEQAEHLVSRVRAACANPPEPEKLAVWEIQALAKLAQRTDFDARLLAELARCRCDGVRSRSWPKNLGAFVREWARSLPSAEVAA